MSKLQDSSLGKSALERFLKGDSVEFDSGDRQLISTYAGRTVLVTGAAGSIGSEIVRQVSEFRPARIVLLDKDENGLFEVSLELREEYAGAMVEVVADVRDRNRLGQLFRRWRPEVVLHAAAYKHVPMMEHNPPEAVTNNIMGTGNVVDLAVESGCRNFLLISTDKAVNPTNVMGASKRVAEMVVRRHAFEGSRTRLCCVRFGNVLGSRASVIPIFQKRIALGKNIQVTHREIQRYFMTIPEAVQLVLQAGSLARRGETFVLDMGDPVKIADLARDLVEQSGLVLGEDIEIEYTGLRPGEKMFEELLLDAENGVRNTKYPKIFVADPPQQDADSLKRDLAALQEAAAAGDGEGICRIFAQMEIGYEPRVAALGAGD